MATSLKRYTFREKDRLKRRDLVSLLFEKGSTFYMYPFKVYWMRYDHGSPACCQVLFSVGKRNIRKAVDRNLIRRRMREAYRLNHSILEPRSSRQGAKLLLGLVYTGKSVAPFSQVSDKIILILQRLSHFDEMAAQ